MNQTCLVDNRIVSLDEEEDREGQDDEDEEGREDVDSDDSTTRFVVVWDRRLLRINPLTGCLFLVRPGACLAPLVPSLLEDLVGVESIAGVAAVVHKVAVLMQNNKLIKFDMKWSTL